MLTIGVIYFNQPEMLELHLREWRKYKDAAEFVVIDDCSKMPPVVKDDFVKVYRITDDIPWNQTGARNLLHLVAENDWVLSTDCDHVVTHETFKQLSALDTNDVLNVYFLDRQFSHGNKTNRMHSSFVCNRHTFLAVGGHDEDLAGRYGGVDQSWTDMVQHKLLYHWCDDIKVINHSFDPDIKDANVADLPRDPKKNLALIKQKKMMGLPRGEIIRFNWERIK